MVAGLTMVVADISSKFDHATNGPVSGPSQNHPHWMKVVGQVLILVWETVRGNSRGTSILTPQIHWFFWILLTHVMSKTIIQLSFTPKRKHVIRENEWAAAWHDFLAVYLVKYLWKSATGVSQMGSNTSRLSAWIYAQFRWPRIRNTFQKFSNSTA